MNPKFLDNQVWKTCVKNMPIFALDIVLFDKFKGILMGKRLNNPAKNMFFVPGGRIYKNETREKAFSRISKNEIGIEYDFKNSKYFGIYEHFYKTTKWEDNLRTHYVVEARLIILNTLTTNTFDLSNQHEEIKWVDLNENNLDLIHKYSMEYIYKLKSENI
tara:strand:- start:539 stop:1021 length:483 start_codon:yes stop_codon:yes gene_type:complete